MPSGVGAAVTGDRCSKGIQDVLILVALWEHLDLGTLHHPHFVGCSCHQCGPRNVSQVTAMTHEYAAFVLRDLASANHHNQKAIAREGGIPLLIQVSWPPDHVCAQPFSILSITRREEPSLSQHAVGII